jgi:MFS family permease
VSVQSLAGDEVITKTQAYCVTSIACISIHGESQDSTEAKTSFVRIIVFALASMTTDNSAEPRSPGYTMGDSVDLSSTDKSFRTSIGAMSNPTQPLQPPVQDDNFSRRDSDRDPSQAEFQMDSENDKETHVPDSAARMKEIPTVPVAPPSPPDGGIVAWLTVLGGFCAFFCSFGWVNTVGELQEFYQTDLLRDYSASEISWIASLEIAMVFALGPVYGKIFDSYGPRWLLRLGTLFHVAGILLLSFSSRYYQVLLCQGLCSPLGAAAVLYPAISSVASWFSKHRALAMGIMSSGASLGGVVWPILVHVLIPRIGFPWAARTLAIMTFVLLLLSNLTVRSRLNHVPSPFRAMDFIRPLGERTFGLLTASAFFVSLGIWLPINFVNLQARAVGVSAHLAAYLLPILNAASVFGRIIPGWMGDRLGRFNVMIVMCSLAAVLSLALWIPARTSVLVVLFAACYGFASGTFVGMISALVAQISEPKSMGIRNGTLYFCGSIAALVGNPIGGALLGPENERYSRLQIWVGVVLLIGSALLVAARLSLTGFRMFVKV